MNKKLEEKSPTNNNNEDEIEQEWNEMKSNLADTANEVLQSKKNEIKKSWATDEILQLKI